MGKKGVEKILRTSPEKENKEFIHDEALIYLEAQNGI